MTSFAEHTNMPADAEEEEEVYIEHVCTVCEEYNEYVVEFAPYGHNPMYFCMHCFKWIQAANSMMSVI